MLPGIVIPLSLSQIGDTGHLLRNLAFGLLAATLIACSNYVLNETLDAPYDRLHPFKRHRPAAQGLISPRVALAQWLIMMLLGLGIAICVSEPFFAVGVALWLMGCIYNIPPIRTKDTPYLDVLTESLNNPIRLLLGWYMVTTALIPPLTLLVAYWMIGAYFMALKRFGEFREIGNISLAAAYRRSFARYNSQSLLVSVVFYASAAMLFFGAFMMRYRIELICSFPFLAVTMAIYFNLAFEHDSAVQHPEKLYRQPLLMSSLSLYIAVSLMLLWIDIPFLTNFFTPTLPKK